MFILGSETQAGRETQPHREETIMTNWKAVLLALAAATPAAAQDLTISCRCVSGGVNAELRRGLTPVPIPPLLRSSDGLGARATGAM